jgi:hypothetical protein
MCRLKGGFVFLQLPFRFSGNLFHFRQPELVLRASLVPMVVRQAFLRSAAILDRPTSHAQQLFPCEVQRAVFFLAPASLSTVLQRTTDRQSPVS